MITRIWNLNYNDPITTGRVQCLELFHVCQAHKPKTVLELGAGYGVSGVAIGLGCLPAIATIVDKGEIYRGIPEKLWAQHGVVKNYQQAHVGEWLNRNRERFDFIFHDADHGPAMLPEYRQCWAVTNKILAIHDVDQFDYRAFVRSLPDVADSGLSHDTRGRAMGYIYRTP